MYLNLAMSYFLRISCHAYDPDASKPQIYDDKGDKATIGLAAMYLVWRSDYQQWQYDNSHVRQ